MPRIKTCISRLSGSSPQGDPNNVTALGTQSDSVVYKIDIAKNESKFDNLTILSLLKSRLGSYYDGSKTYGNSVEIAFTSANNLAGGNYYYARADSSISVIVVDTIIKFAVVDSTTNSAQSKYTWVNNVSKSYKIRLLVGIADFYTPTAKDISVLADIIRDIFPISSKKILKTSKDAPLHLCKSLRPVIRGLFYLNLLFPLIHILTKTMRSKLITKFS